MRGERPKGGMVFAPPASDRQACWRRASVATGGASHRPADPATLSPHRRDQDGTTVLIATHDLAVDAFADEVYHLEDGRILE